MSQFLKIVPVFLWVTGMWMSRVLPLYAHESIPVELQEVGITEQLGKSIPPESSFVDEAGEAVTLSRYFDGIHPVILTLVYYECPNLCHLLLDGFAQSLRQTTWSVGKEFKIVTVSIDPRETPEKAQKKGNTLLAQYNRPEAAKHWHFLTGQEAQIKKLADSVGFRYRYDAEEKQYAHAAGIFVLTPAGVVSRVLYGIQFSPRDLKLALLEAGEGKIGNVVDKLLLFCYHYDPKGKKYALFATRLMRGAGVVTVAGIGTLLVLGRKRKKT